MQAKIPAIFKPLFSGKLKDKRYIIYYGGRGGAKTENVALWLILRLLEEKNINILCLREFNSSTNDSVGATLKEWIYKLGAQNKFILKDSSGKLLPLFNAKVQSVECCKTGSKIILKGVNAKTIANIKSISNIKYCWIEEAQYLSKDTFEILRPTIRAQGSQIILTFNPMYEEDFVYSNFITKKDSRAYVKKTSWRDNPFFPNVLNDDRLSDKELFSAARYDWVWEGGLYPQDNDYQVIQPQKFGHFDNSAPIAYSELYITMDTAFSTKSSADYSVIALFGRVDESHVHLIRILRGQWEFSELSSQLHYMVNWADESSMIGGVVNNIIIEKKASGQSLIQELERLTNYYITPITPNTDKFTRLSEVLPYLSYICLPAHKDALNGWIDAFIDECAQFRPDMKHKHDDQIDALVYGLKYFEDYKPVDYGKINAEIFGV